MANDRPAQIDEKFFRPFIEGAAKAFKIQCATEVKIGNPVLKDSDVLNIEIASMISLVSNTYNGNISLCFPKNVFLTLMGSMLGETYTEITSDLQDGAGELLNITLGQAKIGLNNNGHEIQKAIPSIVRGANLKTTYKHSAPVILVPFELPIGKVYLEICVEKATPKT